ncbi:hypothetical protein [Dichotomicrobium thermohalophilum]|nr:hypothetical protein [Dichotomicrobium thermohalophilum]
MFAEAILKCSHTHGQSELIALAWTLRNNVERAKHAADDEIILDPAEARELSRSLLADVGADDAPRPAEVQGNGQADPQHDEMAFQQALACVSLVFDGLLPDPTNGASRVHPHDQAPAWANEFEATALIGPLLFLRECSGSEEGNRRDRSARS